MEGRYSLKNKLCSHKNILPGSIFCLLFVVISQSVNVYHVTLAGVIFEILWLPVIIFSFLIPVLSFLYWRKEKYSFTISLFLFLTNKFTVITIPFFEK